MPCASDATPCMWTPWAARRGSARAGGVGGRAPPAADLGGGGGPGGIAVREHVGAVAVERALGRRAELPHGQQVRVGMAPRQVDRPGRGGELGQALAHVTCRTSSGSSYHCSRSPSLLRNCQLSNL